MAKSPDELALELELGLIKAEDAPKAVERVQMLAERRVIFDRFLAAYRDLGTIRAACKAVGVARRTIFEWRKEDPAMNVEYEIAEREYTELLEAEAHRRAIEKSDLLLMFTLKKRDPSYRENFKMEHSGEVAIRVVRYDDPPPGPAPIDTTAEKM